MEFRKAIKELHPFASSEKITHREIKESPRQILQNHKLMMGANILYPDSGEVKNFFRPNQKTAPIREALLLSSVLAKGILRSGDPLPGGIDRWALSWIDKRFGKNTYSDK